MRGERQAEQGRYAGYAQELREQFSRGLLSELTPYPHFVVWKYTLEHGRLKERPFNARTHTPARINDPSTLTGRDTAFTALANGGYNGIGFVFAESDPFTGTDLDNCVSKDGSIAAGRERSSRPSPPTPSIPLFFNTLRHCTTYKQT